MSYKIKLEVDKKVIFENKVKKIFNHPFKIQDINANIHQTRDNFELILEDKPFNFYMEHKTQFKNVYSCNYNTKDLEAMLNNALTKLKIQEFNFIGKDTTNDDVFNSLIDKEREELLKFFNSNKSSFINSLSFNSKNNSSFIEQVSALIYTENAVDVYSNKIKQEISKISKNKNEFEIKYLTIMLVGKSGVGKSTLINSILKENVAKEGMGKFETIKTESYQSKNMPIFRLIDTRGIELNQNYGAKEVELESKNYINQQYLKNDPNNFIHCIWYCFTGKRFEDVEIELLNYLRNSYGENKIPIIIVHTQSLHKDEIVEMENYIKERKINASFVSVLAKPTELVNGQNLEPFGLDELVNVTLEKCKKAMRGKMRSVMTDNITKNLEIKIIEKNKIIKEYIYEKTILEFIGNFNQVKSDEEFLDYIIKILGINIECFFEKEINNKSINILKNNQTLSGEVKNFITYYKNKVFKLIKGEINNFAIKFIDNQVLYEKNNNKNIQLNNKRCLQQFRDTSSDFLNNNYYYTAQAYYLHQNIIGNYRNFTQTLERNINALTKNLLSQNIMQNLITECFLKKFEEFELKVNQFFNMKKIVNNDFNNNNYNNNFNANENYNYENNNYLNNYQTNPHENYSNINIQNFNTNPNNYQNMNNNNFIPSNNNEINLQNYYTNNNISNNYPNFDDEQKYNNVSQNKKKSNFGNANKYLKKNANNNLFDKYSKSNNKRFNGKNLYKKNFNYNENNDSELPSKSEIQDEDEKNYYTKKGDNSFENDESS